MNANTGLPGLTGALPFEVMKDRNRTRKMVFYGRVSTEHEAQLAALENQIQWYEDQAKYHPNWEVLDKYIDEGITGTQAKKRPSFLRMIADAKQGKFDLIVTREVCRFARNTVDTLVTTRELKNYGVEVYFVEDNIWTMDGDGELRLTIMATLAQEESRKVSERVRAGQHISRENGVVYGNGNILGYDRTAGGTYVINEEQAETVRMIFDMYLEDVDGVTRIAERLNALGRLNASGIVHWTRSNVSRVLRNQTYMGVQAYGKSFTNNYLEQRRIPNHNEDSYMIVESDFPAIITPEIWYEAERIRNSRVRTIQDKNRHDPFLGVIKYKHPVIPARKRWNKQLECVCGSPFRRNRWHKNKGKEWSYGFECYDQINNGSAKKMVKLGKDPTGHCSVGMVAEWKLDFMFHEIMNAVFTDELTGEVINQGLDIFEQCYEINSHAEIDNQALSLEIGRIKSKINNLVDLRTEGDISKEDYRVKRDKLNLQLETAEMKLKEARGNKKSEVTIPDTEAIRKAISEAISFDGPLAPDEVIDKFVAKVIALGDNRFQWYLNLSGKDYRGVEALVEGRKGKETLDLDMTPDGLEWVRQGLHENLLKAHEMGIFLDEKKSSIGSAPHRQQLQTNKFVCNC